MRHRRVDRDLTGSLRVIQIRIYEVAVEQHVDRRRIRRGVHDFEQRLRTRKRKIPVAGAITVTVARTVTVVVTAARREDDRRGCRRQHLAESAHVDLLYVSSRANYFFADNARFASTLTVPTGMAR